MARSRGEGGNVSPWANSKGARRNIDPDDAWADEIIRRLHAACHPKQLDFVCDPAKRITALVGRGGGKTTGGIARFIKRMVKTPRARCVYIALTKDDAKELIWEKLKEMLERLGVEATFSETGLKCTIVRTGSWVRLVGATDIREVDKLRGKPHHEVGLDETAAMIPSVLEALVLRAIGPRLGDYGGCLWMISTPSHNLRGLFYDATRPGSDKHRPYSDRHLAVYDGWKRWSSHTWSLRDGAPHVPAIARLWEEALEEKEREKWGDDNPIWKREYLGEWAADDTENVFKFRPYDEAGNPYNLWDPDRVGAMRFGRLPDDRKDWIYAYGLDMGHSDAFALQVLAASPTDKTRTIYQVYEFERTKMYIREIAQLLIGGALDAEKPGGVIGATGWPAGMVADTTHLGGTILSELQNVYGVRVLPAEQKGKFASIELLNGDLVDGRFRALKGSKLAEQMGQLQWVINEFGELKENKAQANHSTDAAIYARRLLAAIFESEAPSRDAPDIVAPPSPDEREDEPTAPSAHEWDLGVVDVDGFGDAWGNG